MHPRLVQMFVGVLLVLAMGCSWAQIMTTNEANLSFHMGPNSASTVVDRYGNIFTITVHPSPGFVPLSAALVACRDAIAPALEGMTSYTTSVGASTGNVNWRPKMMEAIPLLQAADKLIKELPANAQPAVP